MWVRRAAIRPVPSFALVPEHVLRRIEEELAEERAETQTQLDQAFERFEETQPELSRHQSEAMTRPKDETALALGYFLGLSVWLAFERTFPGELEQVDEVALASVEQALTLDEEIRVADPAEVMDSDDVIAMEQPHLVKFVLDHIDAALESHADDVDVDDVHAIYRIVLVEILALSYAVKPPKNVDVTSAQEFSA